MSETQKKCSGRRPEHLMQIAKRKTANKATHITHSYFNTMSLFVAIAFAFVQATKEPRHDNII